jgi:soluble lytic murein transglycosylase-like protein
MAQRLIWNDGAPRRVRAKAVKSDQIAADLAVRMQPFVKADDGPSAEALLDATPGLSVEALTEWQAKVAWMYYLLGDDTKVRVLASRAANGIGDWAVQGRWMTALSAWRQKDYPAAQVAFEGVAARAGDVDLRAAGHYWAARADMAAGRPERIQARLLAAAQFGESFYGQLARQSLALRDRTRAPGPADVAALGRRANMRVAAALAEIGEAEMADDVIRHEAKIGSPAAYPQLIGLAESLDLPATTLFLAHNAPAGVTTATEARYPAPKWSPASGWRVDQSLVYAHALEESRFRPKVTSQAGAYGLMQIMPAAATDFARERGVAVDKAALGTPSVNMDIGQRHLERLRDMGLTGGLLPKVIAAYNAGPKPVGEWNAQVRDGGDPLLYIESIPYWETRGYVTTVLRNYWMYEARGGKAKLASRGALAQGLWPRFPGLGGADAVRVEKPMMALAPRVPVRVPQQIAPVAIAAAKPAAKPISPVVRARAPVALASKPARAPAASAKASATATASARVLSTLKSMPAAAAVAGAKAGTDLLRKAAAAMAMQPRKVVKAVTGAVGATRD